MNDYKNNNFCSNLLKEINIVRINPSEYADKLLSYEKYFKDKILRLPGQTAVMTYEGFTAFKEAAKELKALKNLNPLVLNSYLVRIAEDALEEVNSKGGDIDVNLDLDKLISRHGRIVGNFSEAIDYGSASPEMVVINLLVDDGDSNRGNRNNILNPKFKILGLANGSHKKYKHMTVLTYARHFFAKGEEISNDLSDDNYEDNNNLSDKKATSHNKYSDEGNKNKGFPKKSFDYTEEVIKSSYSKDTKNYGNLSSSNSNSNKVFVESYNNMNLNDYDDMNLPEGCIKMDKQEKIVNENGKEKLITKITKYMEDGTINTEIFKTSV